MTQGELFGNAAPTAGNTKVYSGTLYDRAVALTVKLQRVSATAMMRAPEEA